MLLLSLLLVLAEQDAVYGIFFRINLPSLFPTLREVQQPHHVQQVHCVQHPHYVQHTHHVNESYQVQLSHHVIQPHYVQQPHRIKGAHIPHHMHQPPSQPKRNFTQPVKNAAQPSIGSVQPSRSPLHPNRSSVQQTRSPEQSSRTQVQQLRNSTQSLRSPEEQSTDTDSRSGIPLQSLRTQPSRGSDPPSRKPLQPLRTQPFRHPGQSITIPPRRVNVPNGLSQEAPKLVPVVSPAERFTTPRSPAQSTGTPVQSLNSQPFRNSGQGPLRRVDEVDALSQDTFISIPVVREGRTAFNATQRALRISETKCDQTHPVVGGEKAFPGEFEFMAALGWDTVSGIDYKCGGTLLSNEYVVTAAHCTSQWGRSPSVVKLGGGNLKNETDGPIRRIERVILHPDYNEGSDYNDIALLKLATKTAPMKTGCVWTEDDIPRTVARAIGYGTTAFAGPASDDLLKVNLSLFSNDVCNRFYQPGPRITNGTISSQICVGDPQGEKDTCQGDSGGPLFIEMGTSFPIVPYIIGITSIGLQCAGAAPSIYVRVSSYTTWIESIVWPNDL